MSKMKRMCRVASERAGQEAIEAQRDCRESLQEIETVVAIEIDDG